MQNKARLRAKALVHVVPVILLGLVSHYTHVRSMGDWGPRADMKYCAADSMCRSWVPGHAGQLASSWHGEGFSAEGRLDGLLSRAAAIPALSIGSLVCCFLWLLFQSVGQVERTLHTATGTKAGN